MRSTTTFVAICLFVGPISGCAGLEMLRAGSAAGVPDDMQGCVEDGLRGASDPTTLEDAAQTFSSGCLRGEAASCSALGVMYETGHGVGQDTARAEELYAQACESRNVRACVNLGALKLEAGTSTTAAALFKWSCERGEERGCAALAALHAVGDGVALDLPRAASLYDVACSAGDATACFRGAELRDKGPLAKNPLHIIELYEQACGGGIADACVRLSALTRGGVPVLPQGAAGGAQARGSRSAP